jgi:hypothetical protein
MSEGTETRTQLVSDCHGRDGNKDGDGNKDAASIGLPWTGRKQGRSSYRTAMSRNPGGIT